MYDLCVYSIKWFCLYLQLFIRQVDYRARFKVFIVIDKFNLS